MEKYISRPGENLGGKNPHVHTERGVATQLKIIIAK